MAIKLVGQDDATPGGGDTGGYFYLYKYTAVVTGTCTEIRVKVIANGNVKVAIYADNAGEPGARLAKQDTSTAVTTGWNTIQLEGSCSIVSGTPYWIGANSDGNIRGNIVTAGVLRYKEATYSTFTFPDPAGTGFSSYSNAVGIIAGWGESGQTISPSGLSQPIAYGTPKLNLSIYPPGHQQVIAYGTPTVQTAGLIIYPPGLQVVIAYGTPTLRYPQTISPSGLAVPIAYGTPSVTRAGEEGVIYVPGHQQVIAYGTSTILKYVWHVILDGQYNIESPAVNRAYIIGRDVYGNPVYGQAHDSGESALVGERLDFQPDPAIPTTAQAGDVAAAVLAKMRLSKQRGVILIPPNCGQELFDVVQISDAGANQQAVKFRVVGIRFEYNPNQAKYEHRLILGAP